MSQRRREKTILSEREPDQVLVVNRPSPEQFRDRDRREALPACDLTGLILGDPKVGQSALDKKLGGG